eukprot:1348790-Amorphochlora_amoeboformis.AAC.1
MSSPILPPRPPWLFPIIFSLFLPLITPTHLIRREENHPPTLSIDFAKPERWISAFGGPATRCVNEFRERRSQKCIALVTLAGLYLPGKTESKDKPGDEAQACHGKSEGGMCSFMCGVLSNLAHHRAMFSSNRRSSSFHFEHVVMHDETLPAELILQIHGLGARTVLVHSRVKRMACEAYARMNPGKMSGGRCARNPFDLGNFSLEHLRMFLQQLKPAALGLMGYIWG